MTFLVGQFGFNARAGLTAAGHFDEGSENVSNGNDPNQGILAHHQQEHDAVGARRVVPEGAAARVHGADQRRDDAAELFVFLAGYGAAQAVPGPLFTFAAYLGAEDEEEVAKIEAEVGL